ncbi:MAG: hypothetical protein Kow00107_03050 [Planctomycetota bacterium]
MNLRLLVLFSKELFGLTQAALAVALAGGLLLQLFSSPESAVVFCMACAMIFGAAAGGFRREPRVLEFLLTRGISRSAYFINRWNAGFLPMFAVVVFVALEQVWPISHQFWSLLVESGFTRPENTVAPDGFGWFWFCACGAVWTYSVTFTLVSRTREMSEMFLALIASIIVSLGLPAIFVGASAMAANSGFADAIELYSPNSIWWLSSSTIIAVLAVLPHWLGKRAFRRVDL